MLLFKAYGIPTFYGDKTKEDKELILSICNELEPYFENAKSSIYFAFVEDPIHCEKFTKEFYAAEDAYVRLNDGYKEGAVFASDQSDMDIEPEPFKTDDKWIQMIIDSGVFSEYCSNPSVITLDEWSDGGISIKAQPKDVPTILAASNGDGTYSTERFYIVEREWEYEKDSSKHEAKLEMRVKLHHDEIDTIVCYLTVPDEIGMNYVFAYDCNEHILYKYDKSDIKLSEDLQIQILDHCEDVMGMLVDLDVKAHELMKEILEKKNLGPVVWSHAPMTGE